MRGAVLHGPRDVRYEQRPDPTILEPTDAIIRLSATCVCGSDLWDYRGINTVNQPTPMGHEYCGIVEEVGGGGDHDQARPLRHRLLLRLRQHLPDLPGRLPDLLRAPRVTSAAPRPSCCACRWPTAPWWPRPAAVGRPDPQPAGPVRRDGHRLVRGRRRRCAAGIDRGRGRRRRGRPAAACSPPRSSAPSGSSR